MKIVDVNGLTDIQVVIYPSVKVRFADAQRRLEPIILNGAHFVYGCLQLPTFKKTARRQPRTSQNGLGNWFRRWCDWGTDLKERLNCLPQMILCFATEYTVAY